MSNKLQNILWYQGGSKHILFAKKNPLYAENLRYVNEIKITSVFD